MDYIREKIEKELLSNIDVDIETSPVTELPDEIINNDIIEEKIEEINDNVEEPKKLEQKIRDEQKKERVDIREELKIFFSNINKKILFILIMSGVFLASSAFIFFLRK